MKAQATLQNRVTQLGKASRRVAFLSLGGLAIIIIAAVYTSINLHSLENQRVDLENEIIKNSQELTEVQEQLINTRASISTARAAINAYQKGGYEDALVLYDEALKADPASAYLQNLRAYTLFKIGRINDAIAGQRLSVTIDPEYAWGYFDLARFLYAASPPKVKEAQIAEARAIELRPDMKIIMRNDGEYQRLRKKALN